jgi:hypothetical protein
MTRNNIMRGLWRHLLLDSFRRGWLWLAAVLVHVASLMAVAFEGKKPVGAKPFLMAVCFVLLWSSMFARMQHVSYPLLATLPMSRKTRGRFVWVQHTLVIPILALLFPLAVAMAQTLAGIRPTYTILDFALLACTTVPPALMLLIRLQAMLKFGSLAVAVYVGGGYLGWYIYRNAAAGNPFAVSAWPYLAAVCALIVLLSYLRAPRLLIGPGRSFTSVECAPLLKFPRSIRSRQRHGAPAPNKLGPLWHLVLVEPLSMARPLILVVLAMLIIWIRKGAVGGNVFIPLVVGLLTLMSWGRGAVQAAEWARLMRMLPIPPAKIAGTLISNAASGGVYAAIAGAIVMALIPEPFPLALGLAFLLPTSVGAFTPFIYVRFSGNPTVAQAYLGIATMAAMFLAFTHPQVLVPVAFVAPISIFFGTRLLHTALLDESAYHYQKPPLQAMNEG